VSGTHQGACLIPPKKPENELARVAALHALGILDTPPEERFDRYTRMARRLFGVPIALVSLIDCERQWFKSRQGLGASETSRDISFCGHVVLGDKPLIVNDASEDHRFSDNPLVTGAPDIRFYAGHPIHCANGMPLGTVCLIDREPRDLDADEQEMLADLAKMVENEFVAHQVATTDALTGLSNRRGFQAVTRHLLPWCKMSEQPATLIYVDLDDFKPINDTHGHAEGDRALVTVSRLLSNTFREADIIARMGGDEFCVLCAGATAIDTGRIIARLQETFTDFNGGKTLPYELNFSAGVVAFEPSRHDSPCALLNDADQLMYEQKRRRKRKIA